MIGAWRFLPDASDGRRPPVSSNAIPRDVAAAGAAAGRVVSDCTSAGVSARSKIWNSSIAALRYDTLRCGN